MATYNRPGVYVNELPLSATPSTGASAATAAGAVLGAFAQGPDTVTLVTSWYDFVKKFGGYSKQYPASFSVASFFKNGGTELYVRRVLPAAARKVAKVNVPYTSSISGDTSGTLCTIAAKHRGIDGNNIRIQILPSKAIREAGYYDISVYLEAGVADSISGGVVTANGGDDTLVEQFNGVVFHDELSGDYAPRVLEFGSAYIKVYEGSVTEYDDNGAAIEPVVVYEVRQNVAYTISTALLPLSGANTPESDLTYEDYTGDVVFDPTDIDETITKTVTAVTGSGTYYAYTTSAAHGITVGDTVVVTGSSVSAYNVNNAVVTATPTTTTFRVAGTTTDSATLTDGQVVATHDVADSYDIEDCLIYKEFEVVDQPLVFFLPDVATKLANGWGDAKWVYNSLIDWADAPATQGRHFVVVETAADLTANLSLGASGDLVESSRAAVFYPHFYIKDPIGRSGAAIRKIGPAGAVAGQMLYTDRRVGPFKAAAGIEAKVKDAIALERAFSPAELDALNSGVTTDGIRTGKNVVNAIRNLPGAGIVIMGGRTLKQDGTANRYINMRRSLTYIEKRLNDLAQFAVFENNTETLWARLNTVLGSFLNDYRNQGGLRGTTTAESYYIKVDAENNPPASIAAGEVHVEIGVALEYPAEFVVINLSQKTAE
jgi:hypothetical protein